MELEMDPMCLLLGLPSKPTKSGKRLYNILTFAARKNILLQWINDKRPSVNGWWKVLLELIPLEYLTNIIHHKVDQFYKIWQPYMNYLGPTTL